MNANVKNDYNKVLNPKNGMAMLFMLILGELATLAGFIGGIVMLDSGFLFPLSLILVILCAILAFIVLPILFGGLRTLRPNEAYVLTLFGEYYGTLYGPGFFFINPFAAAINPASEKALEKAAVANAEAAASGKATTANVQLSTNKRVSLKEITLTNDKQKINDQLGNPVIIGTVVIWHVTDPAKAVFNVDNYVEFLSTQCDAALRNIVREYPYDESEEGDEKSLRGSSLEVAQRLKDEIQCRVEIAGIEVTEARITHLAYAPEIAAAMLQRQQASAIIAARKLIVDGAVGMVEMALDRLQEDKVVDMDEERKAQMVSNLLVVLCGSNDAQPIVNTGSIY
ncbi:MAG: SPFH domain-containing protein [Oscillospiraceae bacterium]|nr:SPFH domain-containing protein [Oscillospiraceae bacterium]MBQ5898153.1 SPFH domain-containing protein [Oscillospiraceae bacterium]